MFLLGGYYPYDQLPNTGPVKKDAKKMDQPTRFALVEVEVIHMETAEKMCVLGKLRYFFSISFCSFRTCSINYNSSRAKRAF